MNNFEINNWLKELNHSNENIRKNAIIQLSRLDDVRYFKILTAYFADAHPTVRETLFQVFVQNKTRRLAEIVADALFIPQISAKSLALRVLREYKSEAILPLRRICKTQNASVSRLVADLLGDIPDETAESLLLGMLNSEVPEVLTATISSLGKQNSIASLPCLISLFRNRKELQPVILNALGHIFLNWEKNLLSDEIMRPGSDVLLAIIHTIQENGNPATLPKLLQLMHQKNHSLADEIILAIVAILEKNDYCILPVDLLATIVQLWEVPESNVQIFALSKCLAHIPSTDAIRKLSQIYFANRSDKLIEKHVVQWIEKFPAIFFLWKRDAVLENYYALLDLLYQNKVKLIDSALWVSYLQATDIYEKIKLLRLATLTGSAESQNEIVKLLAHFNDLDGALVEALQNFPVNQEIINLYLKYFETTERHSRVYPFLKSILLAHAQSVIDYLFKNAESLPFDAMKKYLELVFSMSMDHRIHFFAYWLNSFSRSRVHVLLNASVSPRDADNLILIAWALRKNQNVAENFLSMIDLDSTKIHISMEIRSFVQNMPEEERMVTLSLVEKYFPGILSTNETMPIMPLTVKNIADTEKVLFN